MAGPPCSCIIRGSINNDEYFSVRSIARPGETISSYHYTYRIGGKGANQAVAIARAGGIPHFFGTIGSDGIWLKETIAKLGLDDSGIIVSDDPTGRALIQIADDGENSIILFPGANHSDLHEQKWRSSLTFPETSHLLLQNEIKWESTLYALDSVRNATTIFNPSPLPTSEQIRAFPWERVDWLIVNEGEARDLYSALQGEASPSSHHALITALSGLPSFTITNIIYTLGKDGVIAFIPAFHRSKKVPDSLSFMHIPAAELRGAVRDTTGAGDCFTGYFVQGLMELGRLAKVGADIDEISIVNILKRCVQAAGICVERPGTIDSIPFRTEVEARLASGVSEP